MFAREVEFMSASRADKRTRACQHEFKLEKKCLIQCSVHGPSTAHLLIHFRTQIKRGGIQGLSSGGKARIIGFLHDAGSQEKFLADLEAAQATEDPNNHYD